MPGTTSATRLARLAGGSYLFVIACGGFTEIVVRQSVLVAGDATATAEALATSLTLWRWGLALHVVYLVLAALTNLLLFEIFKRAQPTVAKFMLVLGLISVAVEASVLAFLYVPLVLVDEERALAALAGEQAQALSYLAIQLFSAAWGFGLVFFAGFCMLLGVLIVRSRLAPRILGTLMVVAGGCYLVNSLVALLDPLLSSRLVPWILLPCLLGELSLAVWLVTGAPRPAPAPVPEASR